MKKIQVFLKNFWTRLVKDHHQITAIYQKDLFQIILSPMFSIICLVCCIFFGFTYIRSFIVFADQSFNFSYMGGNKEGLDIHRYVFIPLMSQMNLLLIFIIPALTMRLFAEEKKLNTFDLLMSAPLTSFQIVFGKFLAAYKSVLILIVLSFIYVAFSGFFADFNWNMPLVSYLGLMLLSMVYVSLGILASSLTQSMVLGVILGVIFNLFLWFAGQAVEFVDHPFFTSIMDYVSVPEHLSHFVQGTLATQSVVFFFIVTAFFIYLTQQILETIRWR